MENKGEQKAIIHPVSFSPLKKGEVTLKRGEIKTWEDIPIKITAELGRTKRLLKDVLKIKEGMVLELDKSAYEPCDILANEKRIAKGEIVVQEDKLAIRITELLNE